MIKNKNGERLDKFRSMDKALGFGSLYQDIEYFVGYSILMLLKVNKFSSIHFIYYIWTWYRKRSFQGSHTVHRSDLKPPLREEKR